METVTMPMENSMPVPDENQTQADFIKNDLNFDVDPSDPLTKASLSDHPVNEWMDILGNDQLRKKVLTPGTDNTRPNRSDICVIKITGRLDDGTIVEEEKEFNMQLGDVEVIQGLDLALALMNIGEEAEVKVHPRFAYGSLGRPALSGKTDLPAIPPDAHITYNVTLKNVLMETDIEEMPYEQRRSIGNKKKERGNWWFSRNECTLAIQCYRKALDYLSPSGSNDILDDKKSNKSESVSDADLQAILEDSLIVHNNLAAAQLKCEAYDAALKSVENVLRCQPLNVKALFRKGKILHCKGEHAKACSVLLQALKIEPDNKAIQQELTILKKKSAKDANKEKNLYKKMLGAQSDKKQDTKSSSSNQKVPGKLTWSLLGGTIVAIAGVVAYKLVS